MATVIDTSQLQPGQFDPTTNLWVYNGLDCCVTAEVADVLEPQVAANPNFAGTYAFERAMQGPALDMMMRGFRIDMHERNRRVADLRSKHSRLSWVINEMAMATQGMPLNPASPDQLKTLFYSTFGIEPIYKIEKGIRKISTNREALEKIQNYFYAAPIARAILSSRDVAKQISVLSSGIDSDSRMRTSYNVAGTETGRWSSSGNAFGTGTNLQSITEDLRAIFVADPGYRLAYIDLEQAESRLVALLVWWIFGDSKYLDACESGDLHTTVCRMIWPTQLPWTGQLKADKALAESPFYRQYSYRDMSKRGGHGTNYYGKPATMARNLKVDTLLMENFQRAYFAAFPGIPKWHAWTAKQLQLFGKLESPLGRLRYFLGRANDDSTLRAAIASTPQGTIGDLLNMGMWNLWYKYSVQKSEIQLLAQVHDAVVFQYPEELHHKLPEYCSALQVPITLNCLADPTQTKTMIIPVEAKTGWNWGKHYGVASRDKDLSKGKKPKQLNNDGLIPWSLDDKRVREIDPTVSMLDRRF